MWDTFENWGVLSRYEDQRVCGQYGECDMHFMNVCSPSLAIIFPSMILKSIF